MSEGRRRLRSSNAGNCIPEKLVIGDVTSEPSITDEQQARTQLRQRWELASVLNFFRIFRPVIPKDLKNAAEEIETALISANENLRRIHIALLMGIPPISKNLTKPDAWITSVSKKLATWWSWVAEGVNPLRADHGREILLYKQLDPNTRLLILKALCDIRAEQDDILQFIADMLKKGTTVGYFRKGRMEVGESGVTYWYEGDPVIGYRLYREIGKTYSEQKAKGAGLLSQPIFESQWETIATNLDEFPGIVDSLSSSKVPGEAFVGEIIKTEIRPIFEKLEKKKARQQRLALQLEGFLNCRVGPARACRDRRPVRYTFDEYDRSIDEAIKISMDANNVEPSKANGEQYNSDLGKEYPSSNGRNMDALIQNFGNDEDPKSSEIKNVVKDVDNLSNYEDDDYVGSDDGTRVQDEADDAVYSDKENVNRPLKHAHDKKHVNVNLVAGLRRSSRNFNSYHAMTKKRLRQRPTRNAGYIEVISDSEDENPAKYIKQTALDLISLDDSSIATVSADEL